MVEHDNLNEYPPRPSASIEDIYVQYAKLIWKKLRRRDIPPDSAPEIHQDVFLTLDERIQKGVLPDSLEATLSTITGNAICNYLRKRSRRPRHVAEIEADELPDSRSDVEQRMVDADRRQLVDVLLNKLPPKDGALVALVDIDGMTLETAAWFFDRSLDAVRTQHRRAHQKLRALAAVLCKE